jgi:hypothetical protein
MNRDDRTSRAYRSTSLPTLLDGVDYTQPQNRELLLKLYEAVCANWRHLVEVRFKLLGLVPTVSLALLAVVFSDGGSGKGLSFTHRLIIAAVGLLVTVGLWVYDHRNSALHDDLISRARKIEEEFKVDTGVFRGRLEPEGLLAHGTATMLVYIASVAAWISAIVVVVSASTPT